MEFIKKDYECKFNSRTKIFRGSVYETLICDSPIYNPDDWEAVEKAGNKSRRLAIKDDRAVRRARMRIADIARANTFDWFVTFTLDSAIIDRYDMDAIKNKLNVWLDNAVRRKGLVYLLIPEHHKDGAIHFHGLVSGRLEMKPSGVITRNGQMMYNVGTWKFGFSTAIHIEGEYERVVNYIRKYITKETSKIGGRYYLSGGALVEPEVFYGNVDYESSEGDEFLIAGVNRKFKVMRGAFDKE